MTDGCANLRQLLALDLFVSGCLGCIGADSKGAAGVDPGRPGLDDLDSIQVDLDVESLPDFGYFYQNPDELCSDSMVISTKSNETYKFHINFSMRVSP